MIRKATVRDLDGILSIMKSVGNRYKDPEQGFLMGDYTLHEKKHRQKYACDLKKLAYAYVYEENQKVKAFLMAYKKSEWLNEVPGWIDEIIWRPGFNSSFLDNFVLINQTAMYPELTGHGIGSMLYENLIQDLVADGVKNIFAETIIAPVPNFASLNFRIKQKYELAGIRYEEYAGVIHTTLVYHKPVFDQEKIVPFTHVHPRPAARKEA
ncbi:MAG: GNAT family N-acetyltransferase [Peptococcaceae bacterium]|jgi:N-acetylglutamate synthase-like GNAT family acetyltransferase|nr:GNAT family N-acetyltransferase [Peptococcaceae bacterium]MDH7525224.1 GNAT family N-acetyltransferase [Peptococcaceae bacterium]